MVYEASAAPPPDAQNQFKQAYGNHLTIQWDLERNAPSSINGRIDAGKIARNLQIRTPISNAVDAEDIVEEFLVEQEELFQLDSIELKRGVTRSWTSPVFGQFYVIEYQQAIGNVPIKGTRAWAAIDEDANIFRIGFRLHPTPTIIALPAVDEIQALNIAELEFGEFIGDEKSQKTQLSILPPSFVLPDGSVIGNYTPVWEVSLWSRVDGKPVSIHSIIGASVLFWGEMYTHCMV